MVSKIRKGWNKREAGEYTERLVWDEDYMYGSDRLGSRLSSQQNLAYGSFERGVIRRDGSFERRKYKLRSDAVPLTALSEEGAPVLFPSAGLIGKRKNMYLGNKRYELKNHLGKVMATITDRKQSVHIQAVPLVVGDFTRVLSHYQPEVVSISDYYPFGMIMPGRQFSSNLYRYGFNGKEKDDEIKGSGNHLSFGDYGYDVRLGRRWNLNPHSNKYPGVSPFNFSFNNPILFNDPDGKDGRITIKGNTITLQSIIFLYGKDADNLLADFINEKLKGNNLTRNVVDPETGKTWIVKIYVKFVRAKALDELASTIGVSDDVNQILSTKTKEQIGF